jgi:hypothetical protein
MTRVAARLWSAGALAGIRRIDQTLAFVGSGGAVPAGAPALRSAT